VQIVGGIAKRKDYKASEFLLNPVRELKHEQLLFEIALVAVIKNNYQEFCSFAAEVAR
jgi:hypothetical protein